MCQIAVEWPFDHLLPSQMRKVASLSAQPLSLLLGITTDPGAFGFYHRLDPGFELPWVFQQAGDEIPHLRLDGFCPVALAVGTRVCTVPITSATAVVEEHPRIDYTWGGYASDHHVTAACLTLGDAARQLPNPPSGR